MKFRVPMTFGSSNYAWGYKGEPTPAKDNFLCITCRKHMSGMSSFFIPEEANCPLCRKSMINLGTNWRPPRLNNHKAWKLIEAGNYNWDTRSIIRKQQKIKNKIYKYREKRYKNG